MEKFSPQIKEQLIVTINKDILQIVINNPLKKNSLNFQHLLYLMNQMELAKKDDKIKAIYITSVKGDFFTAGNDFNNFGVMGKDDMANGFKDFISYLMNYPKLLIAGINGICIGMGFTMLMHFDIILCSNSANFIVPFIQTLQVPEGTSSYCFPRLFGKFAAHILYKGGSVTSEEAKNFGLVTKVFKDDTFQEDSLEYIFSITKNPLRLLIKYKHMITKYDKELLMKVNEYEVKELRDSWDHPDFDKIIKKFVKPKF